MFKSINCIKKESEPLSKHTTFKIGGTAKTFLIHLDQVALIEIIKTCKKNNKEFFLLGNGSNLLIRENVREIVFIKNTNSCLELEIKGNNVKVGSSVSLQKFISFCIDNNLYGNEYLYSVPGTIGGAIYMNAGEGIGIKNHKNISDYLNQIEIFDGQNIKTLKKEECCFEHRYSIFHEKKEWIILSAIFQLPYQNRKEGKDKIKERLDLVKKWDTKYPNAGSIFKDFKNFEGIKGYQIGNAKFSEINNNWIINIGNANFSEVWKLIKYASKIMSDNGLKNPRLEIEIIPKLED